MNTGDDPYDVLGIDAGATPQQVKAAYRKLALRHHPDKQGTEIAREEATVRFAKISNAYELLSDPQQRRAYDDRQQGAGVDGGDFTGNNGPSAFYGNNAQYDDFFASPFHRHHPFHDPFQVFEQVFREEFGHPSNNDFGRQQQQRHRSSGYPGGTRGSIFDRDPFFGGFGGGGLFGGFGGGGMMDDPFFSRPVGGIFGGGGGMDPRRQQQQQDQQQQQQQQLQYQQGGQRQYRDPFQEMFDLMRQQQHQQQFGGGGNGGTYSFTSTSTTTSYGKNGESVTTTTRNVNGVETTERIVRKADGTVHREQITNGQQQPQHQALGNEPQQQQQQQQEQQQQQSSRRRSGRRGLLPWQRHHEDDQQVEGERESGGKRKR